MSISFAEEIFSCRKRPRQGQQKSKSQGAALNIIPKATERATTKISFAEEIFSCRKRPRQGQQKSKSQGAALKKAKETKIAVCFRCRKLFHSTHSFAYWSTLLTTIEHKKCCHLSYVLPIQQHLRSLFCVIACQHDSPSAFMATNEAYTSTGLSFFLRATYKTK